MRADKFFAERYGSRTKAAEALKAGLILRGDVPLSPDDDVSGDEAFVFFTREESYVSNGGYKLACGLDAFGESVEGMVFADLGASTGGFTDCLLKRGAKKVFCVDVGESQLSPVLRADSRVYVMDRVNARYLCRDDFPCALDGVTCDLSFISLRLVLPAVEKLLPEGGKVFALFKPQFECGRALLNKNGLCPVRVHAALLGEFYEFCLGIGLSPRALAVAPIREKKNVEYVLFLEKGKEALSKAELLRPCMQDFRKKQKK